MPLIEALIVALPMPMPVAMPLTFKLATAVSLEFHATVPEMLPVVPSVNVPVAVNGVLKPLAILADAGEMAIPVKAAAVTVMPTAGEVMPFAEAVIVVVPTELPVAAPVLRPTLAVAGLADVQATKVVMSAVVPLE